MGGCGGPRGGLEGNSGAKGGLASEHAPPAFCHVKPVTNRAARLSSGHSSPSQPPQLVQGSAYNSQDAVRWDGETQKNSQRTPRVLTKGLQALQPLPPRAHLPTGLLS